MLEDIRSQHEERENSSSQIVLRHGEDLSKAALTTKKKKKRQMDSDGESFSTKNAYGNITGFNSH